MWSAPAILDDSEDNFEPGAIDEFVLRGMPNLGAITDIDIGIDRRIAGDGGLGHEDLAAWHLQFVEIIELGSGTASAFPVDARLSIESKPRVKVVAASVAKGAAAASASAVGPVSSFGPVPVPAFGRAAAASRRCSPRRRSQAPIGVAVSAAPPWRMKSLTPPPSRTLRPCISSPQRRRRRGGGDEAEDDFETERMEAFIVLRCCRSAAEEDATVGNDTGGGEEEEEEHDDGA